MRYIIIPLLAILYIYYSYIVIKLLINDRYGDKDSLEFVRKLTNEDGVMMGFAMIWLYLHILAIACIILSLIITYW